MSSRPDHQGQKAWETRPGRTLRRSADLSVFRHDGRCVTRDVGAGIAAELGVPVTTIMEARPSEVKWHRRRDG
jgi:hypothetical protein